MQILELVRWAVWLYLIEIAGLALICGVGLSLLIRWLIRRRGDYG